MSPDSIDMREIWGFSVQAHCPILLCPLMDSQDTQSVPWILFNNINTLLHTH